MLPAAFLNAFTMMKMFKHVYYMFTITTSIMFTRMFTYPNVFQSIMFELSV